MTIDMGDRSLHIPRFFSLGEKYRTSDWKWCKRDVEIRNAAGEIMFSGKDLEFPDNWSQNCAALVAEKYFRYVVQPDGRKTRETSVRQMVNRVVDTIARWGIELGYFGVEDADVFRQELFYVLVSQMAAFNSPVWFNIGTTGGQRGTEQASACFILGVEDNMTSILQLAENAGWIYKGGSGVGVNYSKLRSSREKLSCGGYASGPVPFMYKDDANCGSVKSGGTTRRAASLACLDVDHGDILEFINCKRNSERAAQALVAAGFDPDFRARWGAYQMVPFQNVNNSVRVSDAFMRAVDEDGDWKLRERNGVVLETIKARVVWDALCEAAHSCGDPGLQFDDTINMWNVVSSSGRINASNPCQPAHATVLTPEGIKTFADIDVGSTIWSGRQWTKVTRKVSTGVKPVYLYLTPSGSFVGTEDHRVLCNGVKTPVKDVVSIDIAGLPPEMQFDGEKDLCATDNPITNASYLGEMDVYDITVAAPEHTYWTDGLLVSNCSEVMFIDNSACNLASINLLKFLNDDGKSFNIDAYTQVVSLLTVAMDILVSGASYPTDSVRENSEKFRPLGIGFTNLGAFLMAQGIAYDSDEGREQARSLAAITTGTAYIASHELAHSLTHFTDYELNKEHVTHVLDMHRKNAVYVAATVVKDLTHSLQKQAGALWRSLTQDAIVDAGFRNAQVTVCAPTGTISFLMDCDTTGIEPELSLVKTKKLVGGGSINIVNKQVHRALRALGYAETEVHSIGDYVVAHGSVVGSGVKDEHLVIFDTAFQDPVGGRCLGVDAHLKMMAAVQPCISGAISKTVNVPEDTTVSQIADIYMRAWKLGLKSVALYRDGCKKTQPLNVIKKTQDSVENRVKALVEALPHARKELPADCRAMRHKFKIGQHSGYIHAGVYPDGSLGEIFIKMSKQGSTLTGLMDAVGILTSLALQYGVPLDALVNKLSFTSFEPAGVTDNPKLRLVSSPIDYLFRWLGQSFGAGDIVQPAVEDTLVTPVKKVPSKASGQTCGNCGNAAQRAGSCLTCSTCGWTSGCG